MLPESLRFFHRGPGAPTRPISSRGHTCEGGRRLPTLPVLLLVPAAPAVATIAGPPNPTVPLYLDLLKRSLTGALAEDNDSIMGGVRTAGSTS